MKIKNSEKVVELHYHDFLFDFAFGPHGKKVLTGGADKILRLWDMETGYCIQEFTGHIYSGIGSVAWNTDQHLALSASADGAVRLWNVKNGECLHVFEGHSRGVTCV